MGDFNFICAIVFVALFIWAVASPRLLLEAKVARSPYGNVARVIILCVWLVVLANGMLSSDTSTAVELTADMLYLALPLVAFAWLCLFTMRAISGKARRLRG